MTQSTTIRQAVSATARSYSGDKLLQIAMPMGGIGGGNICLNGVGGVQDPALRHTPNTSALPDNHGVIDAIFALIHVKGSGATRLVEGPMPPEKLYDQGLQGQGYRKGGHEGLPRFRNCAFRAEYPFGEVSLSDPSIPLDITITGWNPFIPLDDVNSSLPAAVLEYSFENTSDAAISFEFSYHSSHLAVGTSGRQKARNSCIAGSGVLFRNVEGRFDESFGTASITALVDTPRIKTHWMRGGWFDDISKLWREVETGSFTENSDERDVENGHRPGGSILVPITLAPGEKHTVPIAITWHFPNSNLEYGSEKKECGEGCDCSTVEIAPKWRPFYAGVWKDAADVAAYLKANYATLRSRTLAFKDGLFSSTLPEPVLDAVSSNLAIMKSPTVLRQENGNVWAWEGCFTTSGCCHGSCTHVWNYAQAFPHLFPKLERTLREQELIRSMNEQGHITFRSALPDGPVRHDYHAASDGQFGGIMKLFRDWQICGDTEWMRGLYPLAKRSIDYCIAAWDPDHKGGLFEPHHNTYDIEFWGPDGMCGSVYAGALSAITEMAKALGETEDASRYAELAVRAAGFIDSELFNGEYYQQYVQWEGLRDESFVKRLASGELDAETQQLYEAEGPRYQYGSGCLSDGIIGGWMAKIYGIPSYLETTKVRSTLGAIYKHNFKTSLFDHACLQRPGYANGHEAGLLLCSWPNGGKPSLPFVYSDEVWTGIEYQVASHLIEEGMVNEGLNIVTAVRSRYEGHVRNPFNEYECGSYYARAMASYAVLNSLSGFRYSAVSKTLWLAPKVVNGPFTAFFSTDSGYGTITLDAGKLTVNVIEGKLDVATVMVTVDGVERSVACGKTAAPGAPLTVAVA
ncbi:MAG TPA: GH116 family glycosyl hydrolase [Capsulimonadaceae bacterium]|jgi:uncharacterized protein (DUF608 family)